MKKKLTFLGALALIGAWCVHRNKKYPLAKEYSVYNKVAMNGAMINEYTVKLKNKITEHKNLPPVFDELEKIVKIIKTRDQSEIELSIYQAKDINKKQPCLVYFHGGGFFLKDEPHIHKIVMKYATCAKCCVVFVHYRTSDEHPFPIPFYDCCDGVKYVWEHVEELHIDKTRIAVGGDSAGGALAASCTHWCKEAKIPLCFQMLIYPVIDIRMMSKTAIKYKDSPIWNSRMSKRMWELYLRNGVAEKIEYISPILAKDFSNLPPAFIEVCEFDSLYDEGVMYAETLKKYNIPVELSKIEGGIHAFDSIENTELTKNAMDLRCNALLHAFYKDDH